MADYEAVAEAFMEARSRTVGAAAVRDWAAGLPRGGRVLDLGCGHGIPVSRALADAGLRVHGVDTSPSLLAAFRRNVPGATARLGNAATVPFPREPVHGVVAWGLLFLVNPGVQEAIVGRASAALTPGGSFLVTAPGQEAEWVDVLTGQRAVSLGGRRYREIFAGAGLEVVDTGRDEGGNDYWVTVKASGGIDSP